MSSPVVLIVKDCMACESLPLYGNEYWATPNIDELAAKGTVFTNHHTAGASTAMSVSAMLTGKDLFEFASRYNYIRVEPSEFPSLFDYYQAKGYECHLIWDVTWVNMVWYKIREFGDEDKTVVHNLNIAQPAGSHKSTDERNERDAAKEQETLESIQRELDSIDFSSDQFVYIHLPHVLRGRRSYLDDMDMFDKIVGYVRERVPDDCIYLTTDHGHMNMYKGLVGYGFHVYEPIMRIPLITPRIDGRERFDGLSSNTDIFEILTEGKLPSREIAVCDSTYYAQKNRKTAVMDKRFKYIYNKHSGSEELYDLYWDPQERYNILAQTYYDKSRHATIRYDELYFYPEDLRALAMEHYGRLKRYKDSFWKDGTLKEKLLVSSREMLVELKRRLHL